MSDGTQLSLYSLTRKAKKLKKKLSKSGDGKKQLEVSNDLAISLGFKNWNTLRKERLDYCKSIIKRIESPTFYQIHDSSKSIKVLNDIFQDNFIDSLPDYLKDSISRLKHILLALRDLYEDKKLRQESFDYSLSRVEVVPEHVIISLFYYDEIKDVLAMEDKHNVIEGFHSSIFEQCTKEGFDKLKDEEKDNHILAVINMLSNPPGPNMKECSVCHSPNPISATKCTGCEYSFI